MSIHTRRDALLSVTKALPAAGANNDSGSIDLGSPTPIVVGDSIEVEVALPVLANLAKNKTVTCTLHDSADNTTFAAITGLSTLVVTGGDNGAAAASRVVRLPSSVKRYIRVNTAVLTDGGDNTASSVKLSVLI